MRADRTQPSGISQPQGARSATGTWEQFFRSRDRTVRDCHQKSSWQHLQSIATQAPQSARLNLDLEAEVYVAASLTAADAPVLFRKLPQNDFNVVFGNAQSGEVVYDAPVQQALGI